ncbi:hypothetical protein PBRA_006743 [Plasmodiophora brassicae]|uniref:Uncharacterized protein n=1 Tax=Plasmodiophora brassicae TaxID=37360 RepID=A0A0G4IU19_PLABS|nr:hypothetical protein PBRA_006743 [Plasmodiophora brassicae]
MFDLGEWLDLAVSQLIVGILVIARFALLEQLQGVVHVQDFAELIEPVDHGFLYLVQVQPQLAVLLLHLLPDILQTP